MFASAAIDWVSASDGGARLLSHCLDGIFDFVLSVTRDIPGI